MSSKYEILVQMQRDILREYAEIRGDARRPVAVLGNEETYRNFYVMADSLFGYITENFSQEFSALAVEQFNGLFEQGDPWTPRVYPDTLDVDVLRSFEDAVLAYAIGKVLISKERLPLDTVKMQKMSSLLDVLRSNFLTMAPVAA